MAKTTLLRLLRCQNPLGIIYTRFLGGRYRSWGFKRECATLCNLKVPTIRATSCAPHLNMLQQRYQSQSSGGWAGGKGLVTSSSALTSNEGRIAVTQTSSNPRRRGTALCSGCGAQIYFKSGVNGTQLMTGQSAVDTSVGENEAKRNSYVDIFAESLRQQVLCDRCVALQNADNVWDAYDAIQDVDASVFTKQVQSLVRQNRRLLCLLVVDASDAEHSAMKNLRKFVGSHPVWLVFNKVDLMPRMNRNDALNLSRRIRTLSCCQFAKQFCVSAVTEEGIHHLAKNLLGNLGGNDVIVMGLANVGKTTLVKKLATRIAEAVYMKDRHTAEKRRDIIQHRLGITQSHLPGTTLQALRIPCFPSPNQALWDTPGIINNKAVQYRIFPSHFMEPLTRPIPIPIPDRSRAGHIYMGTTLLIEASWMDVEEGELTNTVEPCVLARIDLVDLDESVGDDSKEQQPVYAQGYLHPSLRLRLVRTSEAPDHSTIPLHYIHRVKEFLGEQCSSKILERERSLPLQPFLRKGFVPEGGFVPGDHEWRYHKYYMDIVFASLGWVSFSHPTKFILKPFCVRGSVFSKRPSLYPVNLKEHVEREKLTENPEENLSVDELRQQLFDAALEGRHLYSGAGDDNENEYDEDESY